MDIVHLPSIKEDALIIPRALIAQSNREARSFRGVSTNSSEKYSGNGKYEGAHEDLGQFILHTRPHAFPPRRIACCAGYSACLLVGKHRCAFQELRHVPRA